MRFFFLALIFSFCALLRAQPAATSSGFAEHTVEAGQTLYSISKKYDLSVDQLVSDNPGAEVGLSVGQKLRVRLKVTNQQIQGNYLVKAGDTYYGIARSYGITVEELKALNNGMPAGLITGDSIVVPDAHTVAVVPNTDTDNGGSTEYDIVVMLPFYATTKDTLLTRDIRLREASIHIYRGVLAAADSLEAHGMHARIRIFDVLDDKTAIHSILKKKEMQGVDLVIGPLFKDLIPEVSAWCTANGAHMVVPVQQPNRILLNASSLSKSVAGSVTQWMMIARYAHDNFAKENIVLIDSKILDDRKLVESFKEEWLKLTQDSLRKVIVCNDLSNLKIAGLLPAGKCLVAVPTNDKKIIAAVFRALGSRSDVDVIGTESWDDMEAINTDMRNRFHVSFPKQIFPNGDDERVRRWQENYRRKFRIEPIDFSYTGYDVTFYFGCALHNYGKDFTNQLSQNKALTIGTSFDFFRSAAGSGFENAFIHIVRTDDYRMTSAN